MFKKRICTHAGFDGKNPAPVQNFHVFGSSYVKSYTGVLPKELGWAV
jgi:hypothetical protein